MLFTYRTRNSPGALAVILGILLVLLLNALIFGGAIALVLLLIKLIIL